MELAPIEPGSSLLVARWATPDGAARVVVLAETWEPVLQDCEVTVRTVDGCDHLFDLENDITQAWQNAATIVSLARAIARTMDNLPLPELLTSLQGLGVFYEWSGPSGHNDERDWLFDGGASLP